MQRMSSKNRQTSSSLSVEADVSWVVHLHRRSSIILLRLASPRRRSSGTSSNTFNGKNLTSIAIHQDGVFRNNTHEHFLNVREQVDHVIVFSNCICRRICSVHYRLMTRAFEVHANRFRKFDINAVIVKARQEYKLPFCLLRLENNARYSADFLEEMIGEYNPC